MNIMKGERPLVTVLLVTTHSYCNNAQSLYLEFFKDCVWAFWSKQCLKLRMKSLIKNHFNPFVKVMQKTVLAMLNYLNLEKLGTSVKVCSFSTVYIGQKLHKFIFFPLLCHQNVLHFAITNWPTSAHSCAQPVWLTTLSHCHMSGSLKKPVLPLCPSVSLFVPQPHTP